MLKTISHDDNDDILEFDMEIVNVEFELKKPTMKPISYMSILLKVVCFTTQWITAHHHLLALHRSGWTSTKVLSAVG